MDPKIKQIHADFMNALRPVNNPDCVIIKAFFRFYIEKELAKRKLPKSLCLSSEIGLMSLQIKQKYGESFRYNNVQYKRNNKKKFFGLKLPMQLSGPYQNFLEGFRDKKNNQKAAAKKTARSHSVSSQEDNSAIDDSIDEEEQIKPLPLGNRGKKAVKSSRVETPHHSKQGSYSSLMNQARRAVQVAISKRDKISRQFRHLQKERNSSKQTMQEELVTRIRNLTYENEQLKRLHRYLMKELLVLSDNQENRCVKYEPTDTYLERKREKIFQA